MSHKVVIKITRPSAEFNWHFVEHGSDSLVAKLGTWSVESNIGISADFVGDTEVHLNHIVPTDELKAQLLAKISEPVVQEVFQYYTNGGGSVEIVEETV